MAQLAVQQDVLTKAVEGIASQLAVLVSQKALAPAEPVPAVAAPQPCPQSLLQAPIASHLPPGLGARADLSALLGPPPRTKAARAEGLETQDLQEEPAGIGTLAAGLPVPEVQDSGTLAEAMLLQSPAISALVSQMAQGSDPLAVDRSTSMTSLSTRGTSARQKLQAELLLREGGFASRMRQAALLRMAPATQAEPAANLMSLYLTWNASEGLGLKSCWACFSTSWPKPATCWLLAAPPGPRMSSRRP